MHVARVHTFALLVSCLVVSSARAQDATPGVATMDTFDASMSLSSDGGTYMYFNKWVGDGVGAPNSYQQFGFRANLFDLDSYGSHVFSETHLFISDHSRIGTNLGGGLRWEYDGGFAGINGFYDQIESVTGNTFQQATVGAEYRHDGLDIFANGYFLLSDDNTSLVAVTDPFGPAFFRDNNIFTLGTGLVERAYEGFDAEAGIPFPGLDPIRIYAGTYYFEDSDGVDETWGVRSRAEARVGQGAKINFVVSDDSTWGTNINFQAEFMFWGDVPTRMPMDYTAFSRRHDPVRRTSVVHTNIGSERVGVILTNPRTATPWTVFHVDNTNIGSTTGTFEDRSETLPTGTPFDLILVYRGDGTDTLGDPAGNLTMIDFQQLLGEGFPHFIDTVEVGTIQLPDTFDDAGTHPIIAPDPANAGDPLVTLANDNRIVALNMIGSTDASIRGGAVDNFFIQRVFATSTSGVVIDNASGFGRILDSTFDASGFGVGISVTAAGNGDLELDFDDIDNTGGLAGFNVVAAGSDVTLNADNITGDNHLSAGFRLAADGSALTAEVNNADMTNSGRGFVQDVTNGGSIDSDFFNILATGTGNLFEGNVTDTGGGGGNLDTSVIDGIFNNSTAGHGIALDLEDATGLASFTSISASGNGIDGLNAIADAASVYDISVIDSTAILNVDDSIDITAIGTSFVNFFHDPSDSSNNGDNGYEFLVDGGSRLDVTAIDVDLSDNGNHAVFSETLNGSTTNFDFTRVDMDDSDTGEGLQMIVDGGSRVVGSLVDSSVRSTDADDNINLSVTGGSDVDLIFTDTPADASADNGLVLFVDGASTLDIGVTNGTFDDNPSTNIVGTINGGSDVVFNFNNVTADNLGAVGGGMSIAAIDSSTFVSTWDGGSISNTQANGVQGFAFGPGAGTTLDMTFTDVTFDNNDDNGIALFSFGPDSIVNLSLTNSPVTNNGLNGVTATLIDTTGTFSATDSPFTNNGTAGVGSGFRMFASADSVMTANFDNSDANSNEEHGYHFNMATNSTINSVFAGNSATATDNGRNGLNFEVLSGSTYNLALTGGDFSDNGQAGNFSGVRGFVDGNVAGDFSLADVSFDGTLSNNNTLHGFEFLVSGGARFAGRLNTTGANGTLSASNNENSGVFFDASGALTQAALFGTGDNLFNDNGALTGADGIDANATGVFRFIVGASGSMNNNGGDGVDVDMDTVTTGAISLSGSTTGTASDNAGHGIDINLVDTTLNSQVFDATFTPAFNISGFAGINDNALNGVDVFADSSDTGIGTAVINGLTLTGNTSGIVVDLTNDSDWDLDITNNIAGPNDVFGISVAADSGDQSLDITGNTASSNADTNIFVEYSGTAGEAAGAPVHIDGNIVDGGAGTTVNEGIRLEVLDAAHLAATTVNDNIVTDNGGHNIEVFMSGTSTVDDLDIDGNISTGAGLDGIHVESASPVTLGGTPGDGLSISGNLDIGNNGDDGIDVILNDFFGDPNINIDDNLTIHDNGNRGVAVSITDNVADAGAPNSSVTDFSISRNDVTNSLGGNGVEVAIADLSGDNELTVNSFTMIGNGVNNSAGGGVSLSVTNVLEVTTTTFEQNAVEDNLGGDGILVLGVNSLFDTMTFDANGIARNAGDGIDLDLDGTPINTLDIVEHQQGSSVNIGLDFLIDGNTFPGGVPSGAFTITNTSDPGFDVTSFEFDIAGSGNVYDTAGAGGFPFTPFGGTEVTTGVTTVNGIAVPPFGPPVPDASTEIDVVFNSFGPGDFFQWDIDADPDPVTQATINGDDLIGSTITVNFTTGLFLQGALFAVPGNPDASQFVSTFTNNTPGGISENAGNGIRLSAVNGSDIGAMDIANNFISENDQHGIDIIVDASNLPGAAAPATIRGNQITDHATGNGFNMVNPDDSDNDIGIDFIVSTLDPANPAGNTITGNVIGTNVELEGDEVLTSTYTGNNISNQTSFGSRFHGEENSGFELTIGDVAEAANTYTANVDAGIVVEVTDTTTSNITVENTAISGTVDGADTNYNGDGLAVHTAMNAVIDTLQVGAVALGDNTTQFTGNAGEGFEVVAIENSVFNDLWARNLATTGNTGNGIRWERRDASDLSGLLDALVQNVDSSGNGLDGFDLLSTNAQLPVQNIVFEGGTFNNNGANGWDFLVQADSIVVVNAVDSVITGNTNHGIDVLTTERATFGNVLPSGGDPTDIAAEQSTFSSLNVSENGGNGFNLVANANSVQSILIDDFGLNGRTIVNSNAGDGIQITGNITTPNLLGFDDVFVAIGGVDITNTLGVTTGDGINIAANTNTTMHVDILDTVIGAVDNNGAPIPSNLFPGMSGDGIDASLSGGSILALHVGQDLGVDGGGIPIPDVHIHNNGGDAVHIRNTGPNSTGDDERQALDVSLIGVFGGFNDDHGLDIVLDGNIGGRALQGDNDDPVTILVDNSNFSDNVAEGVFFETNSGINQNHLVQIANTGDLDQAAPPAVDDNDNPPYDPTEVIFLNTATDRVADFNDTRYNGITFPWNNMYADQVVEFTFINSVVRNNGVGGPNNHGMVMRIGTNSYVAADVQDNQFGGNALDDFHTESFTSADNPLNSVDRTGAGTFDDVFLDDTAQMYLRFQGNSGDLINVTSLGAFWTNNDPGKQGTFNNPVYDNDGTPGTNTDAFTRGPTSAANRRADIFALDDAGTVAANNDFEQFGVPQDEVLDPTGFWGGPIFIQGPNGYSLRLAPDFPDTAFPPPAGAGYLINN